MVIHSGNKDLLSSDGKWWLAEYGSGPVAGFLFFLVVNRGFSLQGSEAIQGLVFALIGYSLANTIINVKKELRDKRVISLRFNKLQAHTDTAFHQFAADLKTRLHVARIPEADLLDRIATSLRRSLHVRNTYVGIKNLTGSTSLNRARQVEETYEAFLSKDDTATWHDVVGVGDFLDGRFNKINPRPFSGQHTITLLHSHGPVLNFLLCGAEEAFFTEVYFGWINTAGSAVDVFYSEDPGLIRMFNNYFGLLATVEGRTTSIKNDSLETGSDRFLDVYVNRFKGDWIARDGSPSNSDARHRTYTALSINFDHDWKITGKLYGGDPTELQSTLKSKSCVLMENTMYYSFIREDKFGYEISSGIGSLSIAKETPELAGTYVETGNISSVSQHATKVIQPADKPLRSETPPPADHL